MKSLIDLRFRPSLIIFLDETGSQICGQLQAISHFTGFDSILCQSVALLKVDTLSQRATPVPLNGTFADGRAPHEEDQLDVLIERTLRDVQNNQRIQRITAAGYPIPNTRTQIFIVGDAHSSELPKVLEIVRQRLRKSGFSTLVCYFVNAYHMRQITGPLGNDQSLFDIDQTAGYGARSYWNERHVPDFCFLYEDMRTYPTESFLDESASYYATAEAIFALLATGISTEPFFVQQMRISTPFHVYENVGSLSTCLIGFPRSLLLEYCSAKLGIALMAQWHTDLLRQNTSESELEKLRKSAGKMAEAVRASVKDNLERPYANSPEKQASEMEELLWPSLGILQREKKERPTTSLTAAQQKNLAHGQQKARRQLQEATENLFLFFWSEDIDEEIQRQKLRATNWTRLILQRGNRAVAAYGEWDKTATRAWDMAAARISTEIRAAIDYLWSKDQNGFEMATAYVDELDEQLAKLANDQSRWREEHQERYLSFLATWTEKAEGEWVIPEEEGGSGAGQARPTMGNQHIAGNPATANAADQSTIIGGNAAPVRALHQHLPEQEERVARRLEQRINWYQARIPSIISQVIVASPLILALTLAVLPWVPRSIFSLVLPQALTTGCVAVAMTALVGAAHWAFRARYTRQVKECKEDLLIFYRRYYAYKCEQREDKLRVVRLLGPLRRTVQAIRERLNDIQSFIEETRETLDKQTQQIQEDLFTGPSGLRDVFIANGERLQREKRNTLEDFAGQISKLRIKDPLEEWHQSSADLKRQLIQQFHQQSESLMEMSYQKAHEQILEFATNVTRGYFKGPLIDLQSALDKEEIWREAMDRVETPLYQIQTGSQGLQFLFACGRNQDMIKGRSYIPSHAYQVKVSDTHEWVLLAAFFRGGLPSTINPEILFPEKESQAEQPFPPDPDLHTAGIGDDVDDKLPW